MSAEVDERTRTAGRKVLDRLGAAIGVLEGDAFRDEGYRTFIDVFDEVAAEHGETEARRVMRAVIDILAQAIERVEREA